VSLHFVRSKTMTWFFFSFLEHQISHAVCFNARGLLFECVFDALLFFSSYRPDWETRSSSHRYSTYFFLFFFFGPSCRPSCLP
jgi:hypothetical protein